ncbi:nuclear cap-binding protein subunit 2 [Nematocida parisii]|uniref:Nuclear cap-binding protein subunit 2 n=1 Tax=Nematocida parisii (strain ERTm3) TaxID=935791 RepID=I3EDH6_NEMP3|nr:nuclear cap-binding protein subunit 2 [Nematocida parisii ERTm1]EIJ87273.1 nuclear cap-binding protein subunit 2 [Nematocida parisii ERTm3]KAI5130580.1 nuclear cap-binding protein subunit 2 [Nematocida parisii]EIJ95030.1 nuclear cap-binding protein subunit 2 [Nematocida parisii ERTm1]KAI5130891.1 nuclear cap-binding protein subunit 2 [Nematocida parisii]KAI5143128.1 nuclear cap-binding protein subunit 2 [Nematocida parisii]|eukprot:XP_013058386.1 nuclear cap-binding protein subunit 2 [Nematocida parisii ERTm1]
MDKSAFEIYNYLKDDELKTMYFDKRYTGTEDDYFKELLTSGTIYVGNLSKKITEDQLYTLFSQCGKIKRVIIGLDAKKFTPCGFAFVQFENVETPSIARKFFAKYMLGNHPIYIDIDSGFAENRQFGRGMQGGQAKDDIAAGDRKRRYV